MLSKFTSRVLAAIMFTVTIFGGINPGSVAAESRASEGEKSELIKKYAPKVYFHKDEKYFPGEVEDWLQGVSMRYLLEDNRKYIGGEVLWSGDIKYGMFLDSEGNEIAVTKDNIASFNYAGHMSNSDKKFYLERKDASKQYGDNDGEVNAPVYVKFYEGDQYDEIQYLFWYPHNGNIGPSIVDAASHQGDWERIMVVLDKGGNMVAARYNAHGDEHEVWKKDELQFEGTHPVVYSAIDSHASYSLGSATTTDGNKGHDWKIDRPAGTVLLLPDDHINNQGAVWNTWENVEVLQNQNWLNYRGRWGAVSTEYKDGPYGPSQSSSSNLSSMIEKVVFYQRDNCIGNMRAIMSTANDLTYNIKGSKPSGVKELANDAVRSVKLLGVKANTLITLYDNPDGSRSDDYVEIYVKKDINWDLKIDKLEKFMSNEYVYVLPHNYNGLAGKISRVEIRKNVPMKNSVALFYEGNNATQDLVGTMDLSKNSEINLQNNIIENDEIRSMVIKDAKAKTMLTFYDSPDGSKGDDWTQVYIKRDMPSLTINTFENYYNSDNMVVIPHRKNGIDGKISRIKVEKNINYETKGAVELYEGNNTTQDKIGTLEVKYTRINFKKHKIENDEARSLRLKSCVPGTVIRLFDSPDGKWDDDVCTITVKRYVDSYNVNTFQKSYEDDFVKVEYHKKNGLDGKVSRIHIN